MLIPSHLATGYHRGSQRDSPIVSEGNELVEKLYMRIEEKYQRISSIVYYQIRLKAPKCSR